MKNYFTLAALLLMNLGLCSAASDAMYQQPEIKIIHVRNDSAAPITVSWYEEVPRGAQYGGSRILNHAQEIAPNAEENIEVGHSGTLLTAFNSNKGPKLIYRSSPNNPELTEEIPIDLQKSSSIVFTNKATVITVL